MKVSELIDKLKELPQDLEVRTEGCDCYGAVATVAVSYYRDEKPVVYLYRPC